MIRAAHGDLMYPVVGADAGARGRVPVGPLLPAVLIVVGLFFPTSMGGSISTHLYIIHQAVFCATTAWLLFWYGALASTPQVWVATWIVLWCTVATALSPFQDIALGALGVYVTMAVLLCLDVSRLHAPWTRPVLRTLTVVVLLAATGVAAGNAVVGDALVRHYSMAYPELVPTMLLFRKPVFTFATHSLAGFFYFLLFYLNFESYRAGRRPADLILAAGCVLGGILLTSVTAAVLMSVALVMLFLGSGRARWPLFGVLGLAAAALLWQYRQELAGLIAVSNMVASFESSGSGLSGRFGRGGNLLGNLELIGTMPLRPIGLSVASTVFFGDSGPVEYMLRGSWPLLLGVYGGFALFLWHNLQLRRHAVLLFTVTLAFEVGMTVLTYHRFVFFLPFAVMHLNTLQQHQEAITASCGFAGRPA